MNILYCGDKNIEDGLLISILSLIKNVNDRLNIYVLTINWETGYKKIDGVTDYCIEYLNNRVKQEREENFVKKIDITDVFKENIPYENINTRFTPCCMLRLFADQIEELPDRILYLDNDVVCRKDLVEFYNQDMSNLEIVGVLDYYGRWFFRNDFYKKDYINSGVLLMNLEKIRETNLFVRCRNLCQNRKMFMPDQTAINKLSKHKKIVSRKYNEQRKLHDDTVLQHFSTSFRLFPVLHTLTVKPWQVDKMHEELNLYEYDDILEEYIQTKNNIEIVI